MKAKTLISLALITACNLALAEGSGLTGAATQSIKAAVPAPVTESAKAATAVKEQAVQAPAVVQQQVTDAAKNAAEQKLKTAVPEGAKQAVKSVGEAAHDASKLKGAVESAPKSVGSAAHGVKNKVKHEAAGKALDLLH